MCNELQVPISKSEQESTIVWNILELGVAVNISAVECICCVTCSCVLLDGWYFAYFSLLCENTTADSGRIIMLVNIYLYCLL